MPAASITSVAEQLEEIARRDYWRGTWWDVSLDIRIYSDANPPLQDKSNFDKVVHGKKIEFDDPAALEKKYGPRPKKK